MYVDISGDCIRFQEIDITNVPWKKIEIIADLIRSKFKVKMGDLDVDENTRTITMNFEDPGIPEELCDEVEEMMEKLNTRGESKKKLEEDIRRMMSQAKVARGNS